MNIVGPPLGKVSIVPDHYREWNINQAIVRFRTRDFIRNKFLAYYLLSENTLRRLMSRSKATAGQFNLTLQICRELEIPICTLNEQDEIVEEIESRLSICDELEKTIEQNLILEKSLRQSILKKAFEGKLVSQDPNDEPAELLLEKVKLEKEKLAKLTNSSKTKTKKEKVTA
jgi:type I restriction enzyme S subunit